MRTKNLWLLVAVALAGLASCSAGLPAPDGARAHARVVKQVGFGPRTPGSPGHAACREWIESELKRLGATVEIQRGEDSLRGEPLPIVNVIGRFGPESGPPLLLCAHYDTRPWCDRDPDPALRQQPLAGANDAGSGVAVLLEVAEAFAKRPPRVPVHLVFFDAEDQGRSDLPQEFSRGSAYFASKLPARGAPGRPRAGIVFDMIGDKDLRIPVEQNSAARAGNLVAIVRAAARATGARHFVDEAGFNVADDHLPLLDAGVPAVDLIDIEYDAWHTTRDLPDQVSPESLAEVSRVAIWLALASDLARP